MRCFDYKPKKKKPSGNELLDGQIIILCGLEFERVVQDQSIVL